MTIKKYLLTVIIKSVNKVYLKKLSSSFTNLKMNKVISELNENFAEELKV